MPDKNHLRILFIGNSHTYYHNLPAWVALMAQEEGYDCDVTMLAHPGWYLHQHVQEPIEFAASVIWKTIETDWST